MATTSKAYQEKEEIRGPKTEERNIPKAVELVKEMASDWETVDIAVRLGVDPRKADQNVRGTTILPHGTGQETKVVVFAQDPEAVEEAEEAGADEVGGSELVKRIEDGWLDFDVAVAHPEMMSEVGQLGRILGPRGLMPNPKSGTVTTELGATIEEFKQGKQEYRVDKAGVVHLPVGKAEFSEDELEENILHLGKVLMGERPASISLGAYVRSIYLSSTQSPSVRISESEFLTL